MVMKKLKNLEHGEYFIYAARIEMKNGRNVELYRCVVIDSQKYAQSPNTGEMHKFTNQNEYLEWEVIPISNV